MISDGELTYAAAPPSFLSWQPGNSFVSSLLLSTLTTLLALQTFSLLSAILLSSPHPLSASPASLHTYLATAYASLSYAYRALRSSSSNSSSSSSPNPVRRKASPANAARLIILLIAPPLLSALAVLPTIERDVSLSVRDASFRGVALGLDVARTTTERPFAASCSTVPWHTSRNALPVTPLADFAVCTHAQRASQSTGAGGVARPPQSGTLVVLAVARPTDGVIEVALATPKWSARFSRSALMLLRPPHNLSSGVVATLEETTREQFRLRAHFPPADAAMLVALLVRSVAAECGGAAVAFNPSNATAQVDAGGGVRASAIVTCARADVMGEERVVEVVSDAASRVRVVEQVPFLISRVAVDNGSEDATVANGSAHFESGEELSIVVERRRLVPLTVLAVVATVIVVARKVVSLLFHSDVEMGLAALLRRTMGLRCCDSMLGCTEVLLVYGVVPADFARRQENMGRRVVFVGQGSKD